MTGPIDGLFDSPIPRRRLFAIAGAASAAALVRRTGIALGESTQTAVVRQTLSNGLTVVVNERRTAETLAVQLTARDGARDDADLPGLSLITSRLMFQGTARRPSETEIQRAAAAVGGSVSRGTSTELSSFSVLVPSREADTGFDLLSDIVLNPLLDPQALERQKQIALQEIAQRRANPNAYIDELFQASVFKGSSTGLSVLGTPDTIPGISRDSASDWRARKWGAANLVLTIVGRIRTDDAMAAAQRYFGTLPPGAPNEVGATSPEPIAEPRTVTASAGQQQVVFRIGYQAPSLLETERYPMVILNAIMTGSSGRLFRQLRSSQGLAYVAGSGYTGLSDMGAWYATAGVDPQNLDAAITLTRAEIARIRDNTPSGDETTLRQGEIAGRQILADETNAAHANRLASQELLGTEDTDEYVRRIRAVTSDDIRRVAVRYLDPASELLVVVGPEGAVPSPDDTSPSAPPTDDQPQGD